jgi:hypothetical protein
MPRFIPFLLLLAFLLLGCRPDQLFGPTVTPTLTITPSATVTVIPTATQTVTPMPTPTETLTPTETYEPWVATSNTIAESQPTPVVLDSVGDTGYFLDNHCLLSKKFPAALSILLERWTNEGIEASIIQKREKGEICWVLRRVDDNQFWFLDRNQKLVIVQVRQ